MRTVPSSNTKGFGDERYRRLIAALVEARQSAGLSQLALATVLGRHQQFVSRYETGERRLDVVEFIDIARGLGCDPVGLIAAV
jgi:transcriptional regulator with XRE-family HTH domain